MKEKENLLKNIDKNADKSVRVTLEKLSVSDVKKLIDDLTTTCNLSEFNKSSLPPTLVELELNEQILRYKFTHPLCVHGSLPLT